jgi:hypothetical protein
MNTTRTHCKNDQRPGERARSLATPQLVKHRARTECSQINSDEANGNGSDFAYEYYWEHSFPSISKVSSRPGARKDPVPDKRAAGQNLSACLYFG